MRTTNIGGAAPVAGALTLNEISQQPELWLNTAERVGHAGWRLPLDRPLIATGAGSSAYAAAAVAGAARMSAAVPTTDLLAASKRDIERVCPGFSQRGTLLSLARSGDSPESLGAVERIRHMFPSVEHFAITCNSQGQLARDRAIRSLVLDPRANDRSLAMTSSFSNLVLAGMLLLGATPIADSLEAISARAAQLLPSLRPTAQSVAAETKFTRAVVLAGAALRPVATEASLKILEMTAGDIVALPESYLGLRHGPMSFLRPDSLIVCFASSHAASRRYETDLIEELQRKQLGWIVAVGPSDVFPEAVLSVPAIAPDLPDHLRTPFEIVFAQLLAYSLSRSRGHDPDNPSPSGIITRVVGRFQLHEIGD
ncbi:MAG TPA: hypothetical protein VH477_16665 [Bryobacteraceae bacterium]